MKHVMLDAYGCEENQLSNILHINSFLNELSYVMGLEPVAPPTLIPYYYGSVKEDVGISAYVLLKGGHITIHTFPLRECYFVDCFSQKDFDENEFYKLFYKKFHFDEEKSLFKSTDRNKGGRIINQYTPQVDFGPHYMAKIKMDKAPTMEEMFDFLENIVSNIGMDEITRANVIKDNVDSPEWLSGIIIIAQSHISLHYNYKENVIYTDIFSCAPFDYTTLDDEYKVLGEITECELIPRGTKHLYKVNSKIESEVLKADTKWQRVVRKVKK